MIQISFKTNLLKILALSVLIVSLLFSCSDDDVTSETPPEENENPPENVYVPGSGDPINAEFMVYVLNQDGDPATGVMVSIGNQSQPTNAEGFAYFSEATVNSDRAYIKAEAAGFHHASKAITPSANAQNNVLIRLTEMVIIGSIPSSGGEVETDSGLKVMLLEGAVDQDVQVAMTYLDPTILGEMERAPGDLGALDTNGDYTGLESLGMAAITLMDANGDDVPLNDGMMAQITMPVPEDYQGTPPSTIPLWSFNEDTGIWQEEGQATLQGNVYVGEVSHFSWWNCDVDILMRQVCILIKGEWDFGIIPYGNVMIEAHYPSLSRIAYAIIDETGVMCTQSFPANYTGVVINVYGPPPASSTRQCLIGSITLNGSEIDDDGNLNITLIPGTEILVNLKGDAIDCDSQSVESGFARLQFSEGINEVIMYGIIENGEFHFDQEVVCIPEGDNVGSLRLFDFETGQTSDHIEVTVEDQLIDLGNVSVCNNNSGGGELVFEDDVTLTTDQETIAFGANGYTKIEGDLNIEANVSDLSPLFQLQEVTGRLRIANNVSLTTTSGLNPNLIVGGRMLFVSNTQLETINFSEITTNGGITITGCANLTSAIFDALETTSSIRVATCSALPSLSFPNLLELQNSGSPTIDVTLNPSLTAFEVPSLTTVNLSISITGNEQLNTLNFDALQTAHTLRISGNDPLTTALFPSLVSLSHDVFIDQQPNLSTITFPNLTSIGDEFRTGASNSTVPIVALDFASLETVGGNLRLNNLRDLATLNLPQLQSVGGDFTLLSADALEEVIAPNWISFGNPNEVNLFQITNNASLQTFSMPNFNGNMTNDRINISSSPELVNLDWLDLVTAAREVEITNCGIQEVSMSSLTQISTGTGTAFGVQISSNPDLTSVSMPNLTSVYGAVDFDNLPLLTSLDLSSLSSVTTTGSSLSVRLVDLDALSSSVNLLPNLTSTPESVFVLRNNIITDLSWLQSITTIGGTLNVSQNPSLTSIDELSNIVSVDQLTISNNNSLTDFCGLTPLVANNVITEDNYTVNLNGTAEVSGGFNPTIEDIQNGNCSL